ncbi:mitochondrial amidoxime-reducing component 1-like [Ptychodera flava]|uniref:mitochondrial amidoxime-reducing component 1-like n=1 Tax=Ptychodera flava TaxID=63121 RepID=UPI00396A6363
MSDLSNHKLLIIGGLAACATVTTGFLLYRSLRKKQEFIEVGKVDTIYVYPVKSCRAMSVQHGECTKRGLKYDVLTDRHWLVVDEENQMTTIRKQKSMILITPSLSEDGRYLLLDAPEMTTLKVPIDVSEVSEGDPKIVDTRVWNQDIQGIYCGQEAEDWLSKYFKSSGYKLLHANEKVALRDAFKKPRGKQVGKKGDVLAYHDDGTFTLMSQDTVDDLNQKLDKPVSIRNFRPNIVVSGCSAYSEDNWKFIKIGGAILRHMKCDERCLVTTVDPDTGIASDSREPITTLKKYRKCKEEDKPLYKDSPLLGVHLGIDQEGSLSVGDTVYAVCQ